MGKPDVYQSLEGQEARNWLICANYIRKAHSSAVANEVKKGDYVNNYVVRVELGPKRN